MAEGDSHMCGCQGTAKFEFKSPSVLSVVCGHPIAKNEFCQAEMRQVRGLTVCILMYQISSRNGIRLRAACLGMLYRKLMKMSSLGNRSVGEVS
ncbi:hypothetical protein E2C01_042897 [Portunus trituberculatus]|uniref:Uncharacterized protein n=1 Tax=Portunus trituberculatus TaxID=210409 RepID=A0A5B7FVV6_PORTR|nr:hypothetical protein [Portunus trituberculatus]